MGKFCWFLLGVITLQSCASQTRLLEGEKELHFKEKLGYYLSFPEDYDAKGAQKYGLLLFLHGGGESGQQLSALKKNGPPKMMAEGYPFPFLVLAPQNPHEKKWWDVRAVMQLLDVVIEEHQVDRNRIYLTGLSRGGSAAWEMAVQYPEKFAALAVVCGMAPVPYAHWLNKEMPIWVFHGVDDPIIPVSESDTMVKKLMAMGFQVTYDRYDGVGHNAWERAYAKDELYQWMAKQQNK